MCGDARHEAIAYDRKRPIPARGEVRMSWWKKPTKTENKVAARHTNGRRPHGPATSEGRERTPIADLAPINPPATLILGIEDSDFREVRRLTNLLLKINRYARQMEGLGKIAALHDVSETKGVNCLASECLKALYHSNKEG